MDLWKGLIDRLEAQIERQKAALEKAEKQLEGALAARARQGEIPLAGGGPPARVTK